MTDGSYQRRLPDGYEPINFYSSFWPGTEGYSMDWGFWVVGVERWQDEYFISYLVHFAWEI